MCCWVTKTSTRNQITLPFRTQECGCECFACLISQCLRARACSSVLTCWYATRILLLVPVRTRRYLQVPGYAYPHTHASTDTCGTRVRPVSTGGQLTRYHATLPAYAPGTVLLILTKPRLYQARRALLLYVPTLQTGSLRPGLLPSSPELSTLRRRSCRSALSSRGTEARSTISTPMIPSSWPGQSPNACAVDVVCFAAGRSALVPSSVYVFLCTEHDSAVLRYPALY